MYKPPHSLCPIYSNLYRLSMYVHIPLKHATVFRPPRSMRNSVFQPYNTPSHSNSLHANIPHINFTFLTLPWEFPFVHILLTSLISGLHPVPIPLSPLSVVVVLPPHYPPRLTFAIAITSPPLTPLPFCSSYILTLTSRTSSSCFAPKPSITCYIIRFHVPSFLYSPRTLIFLSRLCMYVVPPDVSHPTLPIRHSA
jgi:hypothetical protein